MSKRTVSVGDAVEVLDPGLAQLRAIMVRFGNDPGPNNLGRVAEVLSDGELLIEFPIDGSYEHSQVAPYPMSMIRLTGTK
ncbi:MAG TPA: hypothetical protein VMW24_21005 [Sedimentisphaerales bacterium]|nr:hypothetical protein [Sedimentisphaerales bacterium]